MRQACQNQDTRDAILDAVGRLLERYGYRKMTVDDIAHEAGIGKGTAYLHFPSKEEMALGWIDRGNQWLLADLRAIAVSPESPAERIRLMLLRRVMYRFDGVQQFAQSLDELYAAMRPHFLARRNCYHDAEAQVFADVLAEGRSLGDLAHGDDHATARMLLMATNSLLPYSLSPAELGQRDEIEAKALAMADMLLTGLLHRRIE
jgi:AcrR family transcriptional regulator